MMSYTVIGSVRSRTFRVLWALEEMGLGYHHLPAAPRSEEVRAHSAPGKVPVLLVGEEAVPDSVAICTFLADRHQQLTFPAGSIERARQDSLTNQAIDELDSLLWLAARHSFILPEERRVPAVKDSLKWEFARNLENLAPRIAGPWAMGEAFTIADIVIVHCLNWASVAKFPVGNDRLKAYAGRARARPAFRRVIEMGQT